MSKPRKYEGIYPRGQHGILWISFVDARGKRIRCSAHTTDYEQAREFRDKRQAQAWRIAKVGDRPTYLWQKAVVRWLKEQQGVKKTVDIDRLHLRFVAKYLDNVQLHQIQPEMIQRIADARLATGCSAATANRMLEIIRAILRRAATDWNWIDRPVTVRLLREPKRRVRWLTRDEANRLLAELPPHLEAMARFSLATGLRESNVTQLRWDQIDLSRRTAWIHQDQLKGESKSLAVPLNDDAVAVLRDQVGQHPDYVFVYKGHPVLRANNSAWKRAIKSTGIKDFRWHDLRHTWASWLVQSGVPLHVLQELGGWSSLEMVQKYAHLSSGHLLDYSNRIVGTNGSQAQKKRSANVA